MKQTPFRCVTTPLQPSCSTKRQSEKSSTLPRLGIRFGGKEKELHPFFRDPDLGDMMDVVVVEDPRAQGFEFGKFCRHVVMLEPMLQKIEIAQRPGVSLQRVENDGTRGVRDGQELPRFGRPGEITQMLVHPIGEDRPRAPREPGRWQ